MTQAQSKSKTQKSATNTFTGTPKRCSLESLPSPHLHTSLSDALSQSDVKLSAYFYCWNGLRPLEKPHSRIPLLESVSVQGDTEVYYAKTWLFFSSTYHSDAFILVQWYEEVEDCSLPYKLLQLGTYDIISADSVEEKVIIVPDPKNEDYSILFQPFGDWVGF